MKTKIIAGILSFELLFSFTLPSFTDATVELGNDTSVEKYVLNENGGIDLCNIDSSNFDFKGLKKESLHFGLFCIYVKKFIRLEILKFLFHFFMYILICSNNSKSNPIKHANLSL